MQLAACWARGLAHDVCTSPASDWPERAGCARLLPALGLVDALLQGLLRCIQRCLVQGERPGQLLQLLPTRAQRALPGLKLLLPAAQLLLELLRTLHLGVHLGRPSLHWGHRQAQAAAAASTVSAQQGGCTSLPALALDALISRTARAQLDARS